MLLLKECWNKPNEDMVKQASVVDQSGTLGVAPDETRFTYDLLVLLEANTLNQDRLSIVLIPLEYISEPYLAPALLYIR